MQYPRAGCWTIAFVTGKPGGEAAEHLRRRLPQRLRADDAEPDVGLFPDAAAQRRHRAGDERRRGAQVRDLDGRRRAVRAARRQADAFAQPVGLSARRARPDPAASGAARAAHSPGAAALGLRRTWSDEMRTTYCGLVSEALLGQTVTLMGWAHRRRDHGGVIFIDLRDREGLVQVVCDPDRPATFAVAEERAQRVLRPGHRPRARPPGRHRERQPDERQGRGAVPRARGAEPERDAAVPARRGEPVGDDAPDAPRARPAPAADAAQPDAALPDGDGGAASFLDAQRLHRHRDADAHQEHARRRARLPGAEPRPRRHVLRAAADRPSSSSSC